MAHSQTRTRPRLTVSLDTDREARELATRLAQKLAGQKRLPCHTVIVKDAKGHLIYEIDVLSKH